MEKLVYFLSDFHLGAKYFKDPHEAEKRVVRFLDSIKDKVSEIYLMGDILDYWYEYRYVVPRGFVRFFGKIAELSDSGIKIHWFIGNHDIWIFDYLPFELGIDVIDGFQIKEILGKKFFLSHGDGLGQRKFTFRFIRVLFRNRFCQFLFSAIHPRWTIPFAHGWSYKSRSKGTQTPNTDYTTDNYLFDFTKEYSLSHPDINYFIFGHLHLAKIEELDNGAECIVLGDWIKQFTYGVFDGDSFQLQKFSE
mgnify:CR=1 FL=1